MKCKFFIYNKHFNNIQVCFEYGFMIIHKFKAITRQEWENQGGE